MPPISLGENIAIYRHDQLNRLKSATSPAFNTKYEYDANGNILTLNRDNLSKPITYDYTYNSDNKLTNNKLNKVSEGLNIGYQYDKIGNLIESTENEAGKKIQDKIDWTVYGKIAQVYKKVTDSDGEHFMTVVYQYDGGGNRVLKAVSQNGFISVTHYIRDASGNILATYDNAELEEFNIYGSSRLGNYRPTKEDYGKLILGLRNYELSNHLGNVLAVISDKKVFENNEFTSDIVSASDYYPFGMTIKSRSFDGSYRFGFNGKENDFDFGVGIQDYGMRVYDREVSRFFSMDPLRKKYPELTTYQFASNTPIWGSDLDGMELKKETFEYVGSDDQAAYYVVTYRTLKDDGYTHAYQAVAQEYSSKGYAIRSWMGIRDDNPHTKPDYYEFTNIPTGVSVEPDRRNKFSSTYNTNKNLPKGTDLQVRMVVPFSAPSDPQPVEQKPWSWPFVIPNIIIESKDGGSLEAPPPSDPYAPTIFYEYDFELGSTGTTNPSLANHLRNPLEDLYLSNYHDNNDFNTILKVRDKYEKQYENTEKNIHVRWTTRDITDGLGNIYTEYKFFLHGSDKNNEFLGAERFLKKSENKE